MADMVPEDCAKSGSSKDSSEISEMEQLQDAGKAKTAAADSEYESAEEDEGSPINTKSKLDTSPNIVESSASSDDKKADQSITENLDKKVESPPSDSTFVESNPVTNLPATEPLSQKVMDLDLPVEDSISSDSKVTEVGSLAEIDESKPANEINCSSITAAISSEPVIEDTNVPDDVSKIQEMSVERDEKSENGPVANDVIEIQETSDEKLAVCEETIDEILSSDLSSVDEKKALSDDLPETLETYPAEKQANLETNSLVAEEEAVYTQDSGVNDEKELSLPEVNGGTEESESLDTFCGGSTSGDLLDEEGGMEGAAEVEDEDCQFLEVEEEEEEEDGEAEEHEETDDAQEYVEGERQQGDGEESVSPCPSKEKVLDDDEDRRNPQYIPKKGSFYEHDDRAGSEAEEDKEQKEKDKKKTKKLWSDDGRWGHDMFREEEQAPKTREELIACYGYDIRSEDGPPRARRRRRYGRGPNKYTRNWQDEDAYVRGGSESERADSRAEISPRGGRGTARGSRIFRGNRGRRGKGSFNDFRQTPDNSNNNNNNDSLPRRNDSDKESSTNDGMSYSTALNNNKNETTLAAEEFPALPSKDEPVEPSSTDSVNTDNNNTQAAVPASPTENQVFRTLTFENSRFYGRNDNREPPRGRGRNVPMSTPNQERRGSYARGRRGGNRGGPPDRVTSRQVVESEDLYNLQAEMEKMKIQDASLVGPPSHRKESNKERISAASQDTSSSQKMTEGRPKRYSSLRQRGIQEANNYQPPQAQSQYYEPGPGYPGSIYGDHLPPSTQHQPSASSPVNPLMTNAYPATYNPTPYQDTFSAALRAPMPNPPRLYHPQGPAQPVVASPYLPPNIGPNGALINYGGPPPPPPTGAYPPQFQLLQPYGSPQPGPPTPNMVSPQTHELYTGGITYYNPHGQQYMSSGRTMPQKRPKAAIPIVPPPESQVSGGYDNFIDPRSEVLDNSSGVLEVES